MNENKTKNKLKFSAFRTLWFCLMALVLQTHIAMPLASAHGFTADTVDIKQEMNGKYRIIIYYTHLRIGEYRAAHIDYTDKKQAIADFKRLVAGAEFFLGSHKGIHFHDEPETLKPF